jgi:2'-5' RNA ligase
MDIKQKVRQILLERQERKYGCVMVFLDLSTKKWDSIQEKIDEKDIYFGDGKEEFGRELEPHITVLFGLHSDVSDEDIEKITNKITSIDFDLAGISCFENSMFDVLKFDIESEDLHELNKKFSELPHTTDYPDYHPHSTICYLKKGMGEKYVKLLSDIKTISANSSEIVYSKADGTKKKYKIQ